VPLSSVYCVKMAVLIHCACLRYILRIWCPNIISNKDLWKATGQEDINLEIRKRKFRWIDHTQKKGWRDTKGCPTL